MKIMGKYGLSFFKTMLLLFLVNSNIALAQDPYIKTTSGIGQYGYLEKDATSIMLLNSNAQGNISQLFGRTYLNGNNILTYGTAVNTCGFTTNVDQTTYNYNFGANAIAGLIAYTSVHADYCGGSNSYGGNPNQIGYLERAQYIFDLSDRPSDVTSSVIQLNPGGITSTHNVVMSVKIDFGSVSSRILQRFWIQNTGTLAENSEIANDGFKIYYEPATGSETFNGTESNATIYGDYAFNPTNNNVYGHDNLGISIPSGGLRVYVVLDKFAACLSTAKTVQVSLINDGLSFTPDMDTSYRLARVGQTPAAPSTINVAFAAATTGALNGTYYIPSACFPTVASAVTALNTFGVAGPVIFNVLAGYSETTPSGGFNITGTGTAANTITFQKFGTGTNPTFTAFTPQAIATGSRYGDAVFRIVGGDYITIDGFTLLENGSNTTTGASNNMTEFGVGIFYATATNGAQNVTVKNCTVDLDKSYTNTVGIYSNSSHTSASMTTAANGSSAAGSNSNLTITGNAITDVNYGIVVIGSGGTAATQNDGLVIGGSLANGNTITNYGSGSSSGFNLLSATVNGILVRNTKNFTVSYNNITSSTTTTITTIRGIFVDTYSNTPTGTITNSVSNNNISVRSANTSGDIFGIHFNGNTGTNNGTTMSVNNNDFSNFGYTGATPSGAVTFISYNHNHVALHLSINNNTFTNNNVNTSGSVAFIRNYSYVPATGGTQNVNGNSIVTAFTKSVAGNGVWFYDSGSSGNSHIDGIINQNSNNFSNVTVTGSTIIYGWYNYDAAGTGTSKTYQNNTFSNITGGSGAVTVMDIDKGSNTINSNTISTISGTGTVIGINCGPNSGAKTANANIISGLSSTTTTANVVAIWVEAGATQTITNNVISSLSSSTNTGSFKGIYMAVPGSTSNTITGNSISGMTNSSTGTSSAIRGIHVAPASASNPVTISSNVIYDLNGASTNTGTGISCAIVGILISASTSNSYNVNLNTIYNLNATSTAVSSISVAAIATGGVSAGGIMSRNRIYGLTNTATGTNPFIVGFWPIGGTWTFANNMISLSNGANTNGMQCVGVYDPGGSNTRNYYYNSITIGGSSTGTQNSVALQFNSVTGTGNIINNILNMTRTGSGKNYALANLHTTLTTMNCNYNILNATNSSTVVATVGIVDNSFTQWQATGKDANSFTEAVVPFVDIPIADLHMTATCSSAEGAAIPLASPNIIDYDNESRDATYPDIGADEFSTRTSIWNGTAWSTWNGVSFSSAIPTGNTNLEFTGSYSSPASLEGCACTVTSGDVVFNSSHTLSLLKKLTVAAAPTATMTFENNSSLVQINNVTNTGNITYKRTTTPYERYDYIYWSRPVADGRALSTIFNGWRTDYSFTFNTQNFADLVTTATGLAPADSFDDNGDAWVYAGPSATMTTGKGYAVMAPTSVTFSPQAPPRTVSFLGVPNNGIFPVRIYESANAASTIDDFSFIGNPYPSAILADKFITDNGVKTSGTLYFWTHVADVSVSNPGPSVSNFVTADYALYNLSGGTRASLTGSTVPTGKVASGQGFFIEAQANNVDIVFNNSMRDKTYLNNDFFKTSNTTSEIERDRFWLNLQNPDGLFSQLLIGYFAQTTLGFDWAYDGRVNTSNTQVTFYSLSQNEKYKIQARPSFTDADKVPLGYFSIANGQFTISLGEKEGVFNTDQNVYLEDRDMNIIHDLKQSPYTFTTNYGKYENRFILRYTNEALGAPDFGTLDNTVVVSTNHGEMSIKSYIENIEEVKVYDVLGRQLFFAKAITNKDFVSSNITMSQQTLIVKIKLENGVTITRKIIL